MADTLRQYWHTQYATGTNGVAIWPTPNNVLIYPPILNLVAAIVTLLLASVVLVFYCRRARKPAENWKGVLGTFGKYSSGVMAVISVGAAAAGMGAMIATSNTLTPPYSLLAWTCTVNQFEDQFEAVVNFENFCLEQVSKLKVSIG